MTKDDALQQALEALEGIAQYTSLLDDFTMDATIKAIVSCRLILEKKRLIPKDRMDSPYGTGLTILPPYQPGMKPRSTV